MRSASSTATAEASLRRVVDLAHQRFVARRIRHRTQGAPGFRERTRYHTLMGVVGLLSLLVTVKLVNIQVVAPDRYRNLGANQRVQLEDLPGLRGTVRDRNGDDLALSVQLVSLIADPKRVTDPEGAAEIVARELDVDQAQIQERLTEPGSRFAYMARQVDGRSAEQAMNALKKAGIPGFFTEADQKRVQPAGSLASAIVGRTDIDGEGTSGLELALDDELSGTPGQRVVERASDGSTIANAARLAEPAVPGADVTLTLDQTIQYEAERQLVEAVDTQGAKSGVAIVGNPRTGDLLAVANVMRNPDTDEVTPVAYNMAFAAAYEAGSVLKLVTVAGAYESGETNPDELISVPWHLQVGDHEYSDHDWHPTESWRVDDIVAQSSNIGTIMLGQRVGPQRLEGFLRDFGFGQPTPLELPGESGGILSSSDDWYATDQASISIGQGLAVTPIQLWSAYNVIANEGSYVSPRLVKESKDPDGTVRPGSNVEQRQVIRPETARWMNSALQNVVDEGTATEWQIPGYSVAAKTGTARKPNPDNGSYDWGGGSDPNYRYTTVFSGFLPASDPELSITVLIDEPTNNLTGSLVAGPVFNELAKAGLNHLRIPPDRPHVPTVLASTDAEGAPVRATPAPAAAPRSDQSDAASDSDGDASGQEATAGTAAAAGGDGQDSASREAAGAGNG
ncbi:MAG: penicillin-binding protein 2 [Microthrixaceae bacterium]